ncbi:MAG TPA: CsbD family protein [Polyangiaceae bacterium]|nr:CsbD family protein [Polyangiaceae bacterium]
MRERNMQSKVQGTLETLGGRIKRALGAFMGHERTEVQGRAQELRGQEKVERGAAAERREGAVQQAAGTVKRATGELVGNERVEAEGRANELEGRDRQELNR